MQQFFLCSMVLQTLQVAAFAAQIVVVKSRATSPRETSGSMATPKATPAIALTMTAKEKDLMVAVDSGRRIPRRYSKIGAECGIQQVCPGGGNDCSKTVQLNLYLDVLKCNFELWATYPGLRKKAYLKLITHGTLEV